MTDENKEQLIQVMDKPNAPHDVSATDMHADYGVDKISFNHGNVIFTTHGKILTPEDNLNYNKEKKAQHAMFKTTNSLYGEFQVTPEVCPLTHNTKDSRFTLHLHRCGMYRYYGLNTGMDKSNIMEDPPRP